MRRVGRASSSWVRLDGLFVEGQGDHGVVDGCLSEAICEALKPDPKLAAAVDRFEERDDKPLVDDSKKSKWERAKDWLLADPKKARELENAKRAERGESQKGPSGFEWATNPIGSLGTVVSDKVDAVVKKLRDSGSAKKIERAAKADAKGFERMLRKALPHEDAATVSAIREKLVEPTSVDLSSVEKPDDVPDAVKAAREEAAKAKPPEEKAVDDVTALIKKVDARGGLGAEFRRDAHADIADERKSQKRREKSEKEWLEGIRSQETDEALPAERKELKDLTDDDRKIAKAVASLIDGSIEKSIVSTAHSRSEAEKDAHERFWTIEQVISGIYGNIQIFGLRNKMIKKRAEAREDPEIESEINTAVEFIDGLGGIESARKKLKELVDAGIIEDDDNVIKEDYSDKRKRREERWKKYLEKTPYSRLTPRQKRNRDEEGNKKWREKHKDDTPPRLVSDDDIIDMKVDPKAYADAQALKKSIELYELSMSVDEDQEKKKHNDEMIGKLKDKMEQYLTAAGIQHSADDVIRFWSDKENKKNVFAQALEGRMKNVERVAAKVESILTKAVASQAASDETGRKPNASENRIKKAAKAIVSLGSVVRVAELEDKRESLQSMLKGDDAKLAELEASSAMVTFDLLKAEFGDQGIDRDELEARKKADALESVDEKRASLEAELKSVMKDLELARKKMKSGMEQVVLTLLDDARRRAV